MSGAHASRIVLPDPGQVQAEIDELGLGVDAPELHGGLCGWLCGGGDPQARDWLAQVLADPGQDPAAAHGALQRLHAATRRALDDPEFGLSLLLPDEAHPISERGDALLGWCRGFVGGFGLAAGAQPPLGEESREALADLSKIAMSELSYEDPERDEDAFEEVAEYVRVAALLLHGDCVLGPRHRRSLN
jgi:hypothetical protein